MGSFYLTCGVFVFVVLGLIAWVAGLNIFRFVYHLRDELLAVLGTSSSESVLVPLRAAGVTGSGFITLATTLAVVPVLPPKGLALVLGVDRFMSEARALTNTVGNALATVVIAKWKGEFRPRSPT